MNHRTWVVEEAGGPFIETIVPRPVAGEGEVLVKIAASGVSVLDTKIRAGKAAHAKQSLPAVLGLEMAGTVVETGPGVTRFRDGDEVYGMVGGVGGIQGTLAEFIAADADLLSRKPKNLTMREAASLPLNFVTAWEGLVDRAAVAKGETVLVHGGAGGVGHLVCQIAKAHDADVFATVSQEKSSIVAGFGVTPIDYKSVSLEQYLARYTDGNGFDIVYDTLGGATLDDSFKAVKMYTGHVVSCLGWGTHALAPLSFRSASYSGVFTLIPMLTGQGRSHHGEILTHATELAEGGRLKPLVNEHVFTTSNIAEAHSLAERSPLGKVVIDIYR